MTSLPGKAVSLWMDTTSATEHPPLAENTTAQVCVVGAGVTGLTTALLLQRAGRDVVVIEAGTTAGGVTGHTTAKVTALHTLIYAELRDKFGAGGARTYAEAQQEGLEQIASLVQELGIDCGFRRRSAYTYATSDDTAKQVTDEVEAAREAGLAAVEVAETPLPYSVVKAVRLDDQAEFDARAYVLGLAREFTARGGRIFEHTVAKRVTERGGPAVHTPAGRTVSCEDVVIASHYPFLDRGLFFPRLTPKRSYCIAVRPGGSVPDGMFISAGPPTRSVRSAPYEGGELLVVGGEGHNAGEEGDSTDERYLRLAAWAADELGARDVTHRWSSQDLQPADGVPYVGRLTPLSRHVWTATGYRKWGFTNGTAAAQILCDRITGRENPWASFFDTARFTPLRSAKGVFSEGLKDARHMVGDRFKRAEGDSLDDVAPGEGKLVKVDGELAAASRDEDGTLHAVSPVCTHLGCRVAWNVAERSWDCPCHGSRFDRDGTGIQGPAVDPLKPVAVPTEQSSA